MSQTRHPRLQHVRAKKWVSGTFFTLLILFPLIAAAVAFLPVMQGADAKGGKHHPHNQQSHGNDQGNNQGNNQGQAQGDAAVFNCTLTVPNNPLTAAGLATPYLLSGPGQVNGSGTSSGGGDSQDQSSAQSDQGKGNQQGCRENNMNTAAFVEASILDPATSTITIYRPLVVDTANPTPLIAPIAPPLPVGAVVALDFGFGGTNLTLKDTTGGQTLQQANCVNGLNGNVFGQVAYCNQLQFFQAAAQAKIAVPALQMGTDGKACQTTNDPATGDMDPNDNTNTSYLLVGDRVAQNTAANAQLLAGKNVVTMANASDTGLLTNFINKALDCSSFTVQEVTNPHAPVPSTTEQLSQLFAAARQAQTGRPVNFIPAGDPMAKLNMQTPNLAKLTLLRTLVDQPPATAADVPTASTVTYCQNLLQFGLPKIALDKPFTQVFGSPNAMMANNLFTFLANRFMMTFGAMGLNCVKLLHVPNPVKVQMQNNVVVAATINLNLVSGGTPGPTLTPTPSPLAPPTVLIDGTPLVGQTATINGAPATVTVNGTTVTITSSKSASVPPATTTPTAGPPTTAGVSVVIDGTPLVGQTATINGAPATILVNGMTVTITSSVQATGTPTPTPTSTVAVIIDGSPLVGQTATINGAPATITINGRIVSVSSSVGVAGTPTPTPGAPSPSGGVTVLIDGTPLVGQTTTINGAPATVLVNGTTVTIASSVQSTGTATPTTTETGQDQG